MNTKETRSKRQVRISAEKKRKRKEEKSQTTKKQKSKDDDDNNDSSTKLIIRANRQKYERFIYLIFLMIENTESLLEDVFTGKYDSLTEASSEDDDEIENLYPTTHNKPSIMMFRESYVHWYLLSTCFAIEMYLFPNRPKKSMKTIKLQEKYNDNLLVIYGSIVSLAGYNRPIYKMQIEPRDKIEKALATTHSFVTDVIINTCTPSYWDYDTDKNMYLTLNKRINKFIVDFFCKIKYSFHGKDNRCDKIRNIHFNFY